MLPQLQKSLPSDVKLGIIVNTSDNILNTIDSLEETIMYAMLFVILVVFVFLGRWRATVIICITIPMSLVASFIYLGIIDGGSLNIISLSCLSIAIGNVVDDAIVVLENVTTHIERGSEPKQAAIHATNEVAISVIASTLTMIAVFFPLTMVSGMSGVLFRQLGWMMCVIMTVSTVSALSFTPMMCAQLLRLQKKQSKMFLTLYTPIQRALDGLDVWYQNRLNWAVRHRLTVMIGCAAFFVASLFCAKYIGTEFFPAADNSRIGINLQLPIGARVERAEALASELTNKWMTRYGDMMKVCNYTVGQADSDNTFASMQDNGSHIISFNISLVDPADRDVTLETVCEEMREDLKAYPEFSKAQVIFGGSNTGMSAQASADFEVYGYSMEETDSVAARLKRELLNVKGVSEVNISRSDYQPEYQVDFDREKLQERLAKLAGGVAVIKVGAATEVEAKERKHRIEDAVRNAKAAIEEGLLPGGGVALVQAAAKAESDVKLEGDEATGAAIVFRAIEAPIKQIAENAGLSGDVVIDKVRSLPDGQGLNAATNEYEDLLAAGVTDPVKVTRSALQNAASIAGLFLTTEAVVANKPEPPAAAPAAGADMGY